MNHEQIGFFDDGQKIADELPVGFGTPAVRPSTPAGVDFPGRCACRPGLRHSWQVSREAVFHEPFEGGGAVVVGELIDVTLAVEDDVEDIIMIPRQNLALGSFSRKSITPRESGPRLM